MRIGGFAKILVLASVGLAVPAQPQQAPTPLPLATAQNEPLLVSADLREATDLSGPWHYSIDPFRAGLAGAAGLFGLRRPAHLRLARASGQRSTGRAHGRRIGSQPFWPARDVAA